MEINRKIKALETNMQTKREEKQREFNSVSVRRKVRVLRFIFFLT